jgi:hypothetical protein
MLDTFTPKKIPDTHFCYRLSTRAIMQLAAARIRSIEESSDLNGNGTHNNPACSIVPQHV